METIWLLRNENSTSTKHDSHDSGRGPRRLLQHMMEGPASLLSKMQLMTGVTLQSRKQRDVDLLLRNRLEGDASQYKRLLDRELLKDPVEGLNYFKRCLQPHFIKTVFLYRFMKVMKHNKFTEVQWTYNDGRLDFSLLQTDSPSLGWISFQI